MLCNAQLLCLLRGKSRQHFGVSCVPKWQQVPLGSGISADNSLGAQFCQRAHEIDFSRTVRKAQRPPNLSLVCIRNFTKPFMRTPPAHTFSFESFSVVSFSRSATNHPHFPNDYQQQCKRTFRSLT